MHWRCMTWAECLRMAWDGRLTWLHRRNGTGKRWQLFVPKNRLQRRNSVRISSTGLAKCMQLDLVQNKVMNLRRNGSPRRQIQTTSMRSIPWQDFITADRVWSRSILVHFSCIKTLQNREILMPAMSWQRCIGGGIGTAKDSETAEQHFREAFAGFCRLEKESHDDKLQYRLGQMLYTGTGTERDDTVAAEYWQRAAKLGNVNAQYAIGKLWLENGAGDPEQAVVWLMKAAEGGNASAQYALGKMYRDGEHLEKDVK